MNKLDNLVHEVDDPGSSDFGHRKGQFDNEVCYIPYNSAGLKVDSATTR